MQTVYHIYVSDTQWFFHEDGTFITGWSVNDAQFREEYMGPLFAAFDIEFEQVGAGDERFEEFAQKVIDEQPQLKELIDPYLNEE